MKRTEMTDELLNELIGNSRELSSKDLELLEKGQKKILLGDAPRFKEYIYIRKSHNGHLEMNIENISFQVSYIYTTVLESVFSLFEIGNFIFKNCFFSELINRIHMTDGHVEYMNCFFKSLDRIWQLKDNMKGGQLSFFFCDFNESKFLIEHTNEYTYTRIYYSTGIKKVQFKTKRSLKTPKGAHHILKIRYSTIDTILFDRNPSLQVTISESNIENLKMSFPLDTPVGLDIVGSSVTNLILRKALVDDQVKILNSEIEKYLFSNIKFSKHSKISLIDVETNNARIVDCDLSICSFETSNANLDNVLFSRNQWNLINLETIKKQFTHKSLEDLRITLSELKASHKKSHDFDKVDTFKILEYTAYRDELKSKNSLGGRVEYILLSFDYIFSRHLTSPLIIISWFIIIPFTLSIINFFAFRTNDHCLMIIGDIKQNIDCSLNFLTIIAKNVLGLIAPVLKYNEDFLLSKKVFYSFKVLLYPYLVYQLVMTLRKYSRIS